MRHDVGQRPPKGILVRTQRRGDAFRRFVGASVAVIVGLLSLQGAAAIAAADTDTAAVRAPHLPKIVNAPGTWSDEHGPTGRLAALGIAMRTKTSGWTGKRESPQLFGVSASDGRATWIDLPGVDMENMGLASWFALSPDGRWIGWARGAEQNTPEDLPGLVGWAVMDTTTRKVRKLTAPTDGPLQGTMSDIVFSGDSRYLLASYDTADAPANHGHRFVALNVATGASSVLEEPGHYWLPNPGSAPNGVAWARGHNVYRQDVTSGKRSSFALRDSVVTASWSPSNTSFAYISQPANRKAGKWVLHAGKTLDEARDHVVPLKVDPGEILGWRDDRHVVVGHFRKSVQVVDVVTDKADTVDLAGYGQVFNEPLLAADLWRSPLRSPVEPSGMTDPRIPYRWAGATLVALLGTFVLLRRRRAHS